MAVDKLVDSAQLESDLTDIADAIRAKTGGTADLAFPDDFVSEIEGISEEKDVAFYDYDGTLLYTYDEDEFADLTSLPALVNHYPDLEAVGWNWTLAEAKAYVAKYGGLSVGQICNPVDCATRMVLTVDDGEEVSFGFAETETYASITIDWGDGSPQEVSASTNTHVYPAAGKYVIKVITDNVTLNRVIFSDVSNNVEEVNFGSQVTAFGANYQCFRNLRRLSMSGLTSWSINAFNGNPYLQALIFPRSISTLAISTASFVGVKAFSLPPTVTAGVPNLPNVKILTMPETEAPTTEAHSAGILGACKVLVLPNHKIISLQRYTSLPALKKMKLGTTEITAGSCFDNVYTLEELDLTNVVINGLANFLTFAYALRKLTLPNEMTSIGGYNYTAVQHLKEITIPASVTTISNNCFTEANQLEAVHMKPTTPPTLGGTSIFTGRKSTCVIYVPYSQDHSVLESYQTATNWSSFASIMQEEVQND